MQQAGDRARLGEPGGQRQVVPGAVLTVDADVETAVKRGRPSGLQSVGAVAGGEGENESVGLAPAGGLRVADLSIL